jgi:hypothetical protein
MSKNVAALAVSLADRLISGRAVVDAFEKQIIVSLKVEDMTLAEWAKELHVLIPDNPEDQEAIETALLYIGSSVQRAGEVLARFELDSNAIEYYTEHEFALTYVLEMENNSNKRIGADKLEQRVLASESINTLKSASQSAALVRDFFKQTIRSLESARKSIEGLIELKRMQIQLTRYS